MDYRQFPKIELHLHLDCSLSYQVVKRIAPGVSEADYRDRFIAPPKCLDLSDYISRASRGIELMQNREQLRLVTFDLLEQLDADNVLYAEIRFAPLLHTRGGLKPGEVVESVLAALEEGEARRRVETRLLLCTLRHYSEAQSLETVRLVESFKGSKVVGFDIASDEANFPIDEHIKAFYYAREREIPRTAHAGEARGADSVWETLENFAPSRIGHGVRSVEDPKLIEHLAEKQIHLEVCPTSNIQTDVFRQMADHPIDRLLKLGLSIGVNTDARTVSPISLADEYQTLEDYFNWGREELLKCNLFALEAAFLEEKTRKRLKEKLIKFI